jgi:hypothetical protein
VKCGKFRSISPPEGSCSAIVSGCVKDKSGGCYVPVSTAVSVLGVLGVEPAFPSEEPCMAVTCTNPLLLVLNSYP